MSDSSGTPESWISSFCSCLGHEYFAEVTEDFIEDDFNLTGLQTQVPMYKEALEMILDVEPEEDEDEEDEEEEEEEEEEEDDDDVVMRDENGDKIPSSYRRSNNERKLRLQSGISVIESSAELLYGLIHQRYITSRPGIQQMADKYESQHFGCCPRVFCNSARVLPVGCSDTPGQETVKLFCPSCLDVYTPPNSRFQSVDGAFFGTTFGCLFFMTFPEFDVSSKNDPLNLASTHPIFATGATLENQALLPPNVSDSDKITNNTNKHSRSSSLNSTPITGHPPSADQIGLSTTATTQTDPPTPLPPQPTTLNGTTATNLAPGLGQGKMHEPKIYGFRVAERAKTGPRMKWLRSRPRDMNELDEARRWVEMHGEGGGRVNGGGAGAGGMVEVDGALGRRKKAPIRTRRRGGGVGGTGGGGTGGDEESGVGGGAVVNGGGGTGAGVEAG